MSRYPLVLAAVFANFLLVSSPNAMPVLAGGTDLVEDLSQSNNATTATNAKQLASMLQFRTWTSAAGSTLRAKFSGIQDKKIILTKADGEIAVPIQSLSVKDQGFVMSLFFVTTNLLDALGESRQTNINKIAELEKEIVELTRAGRAKERLMSLAGKKLESLEKDNEKLKKMVATESRSQTSPNRVTKPANEKKVTASGARIISGSRVFTDGEAYIGRGNVAVINVEVVSVESSDVMKPSGGDWKKVSFKDSNGNSFEGWATSQNIIKWIDLVGQRKDIEGYMSRSELVEEVTNFIVTKVDLTSK